MNPFDDINYTIGNGESPETPTGLSTPIVVKGDYHLTKGRITVFSADGTVMSSRDFIANPHEVKDIKGIEWGSAKVAGASHPVYQFGGGGERTITFELFIDGLRSVPTAEINTLMGSDGIDISDTLNWYRALIYPQKYRQETFEVFPPIVLFSFGSMWQSVECLVKKADITVTYFSPELRPIRAKVSMALIEIAKESKKMSDISPMGVGA